MSKINRHPVRRTAAGVLAGALALSGVVATALPANAAPTFELTRVAGDDRFETSALAVAAFGPAPGAILAAGENGRSADALAASFLAGVRGVPVALTTKNRVTDEVLAALNGLGGKNITIVGGPEAVSEAVVTQLRTAGFTVDRVSGANRYETAREIVEEGESAAASNIGIVASGQTTIDALAGGPLAYAGKHPVLLVTRDGVPGATLRAIRASGVTSVFVLGGEAAVGPNVVEQLRQAGVTVRERLSGDNRSETSVAIANRLIADFGFSAATFNLASGLNEGVDALSAAALSGKERRVLLLTQNANTAPAVTGFATANAARLTATGRVFGGTTAVSADFEERIEAAAGAADGFQTLNVTPQDAATLQLADDEDAGDAEATSDNRTYTVTGLNDALTYRITLVNAAGIQGTGTNRTFLSSAITGATPAAFAVATGADIADIVAVGGTAGKIDNTGGDNTFNTATVRPVNGSITFTIDGTGTGTVVPAVYVNGGQGGTATTGGADNRLETSATAADTFAAVTETFGLGGPTTFINPTAASGNFGRFADPAAAALEVQSVDKDNNRLDAADSTFSYDANDVFRVDGIPSTLDEFEAALSSDDTFSASYSASTGASSTFELTNANPVAPTRVDAAAGTGANSNDISVEVSLNGTLDTVVIQRATVTGGMDEMTDGTVGAYATVATITPTAAQRTAGEVVFEDANLATGVYRYRAAFVNDGDQGDFTVDTNEAATAPPAADTTAPTVLDTRVVANAGSAFLLETGDTFRLVLSEVAAAPTAGDTLRVTDADGTIVDIVAVDGNDVDTATDNFVLNAEAVVEGTTSYAAGRILTVTRGANITVVEGSQGGLGLPATITAQSGTTDVAGLQINLAGSADLVIDTE